jgi:hypothetical protein
MPVPKFLTGLRRNVIEVRYKARLGNNLFQYCLGRILAEGLDFALYAKPIPGFPNTAQRVAGASCEEPEQILAGQRIDLDGTLADRSARRLVLDGWFQRHEYYRPHRAKIREWLAFDPSIHVPDRRPDVVVHVRRTDFVQLGWALPFSYYAEALQRLLPKGGNVWIVTDDNRDPFFGNFARWRPTFYSGTALEQMLFMTKARRLVMSQSTFSWWSTFLGDPDEVVCPLPSFGAWSEQGEASEASLMERDRFLCLECREPYRPTKSEAWHQKQRARWRRVVLGLNRRLGLSLPEPPP